MLLSGLTSEAADGSGGGGKQACSLQVDVPVPHSREMSERTLLRQLCIKMQVHVKHNRSVFSAAFLSKFWSKCFDLKSRSIQTQNLC